MLRKLLPENIHLFGLSKPPYNDGYYSYPYNEIIINFHIFYYMKHYFTKVFYLLRNKPQFYQLDICNAINDFALQNDLEYFIYGNIFVDYDGKNGHYYIHEYTKRTNEKTNNENWDKYPIISKALFRLLKSGFRNQYYSRVHNLHLWQIEEWKEWRNNK